MNTILESISVFLAFLSSVFIISNQSLQKIINYTATEYRTKTNIAVVYPDFPNPTLVGIRSESNPPKGNIVMDKRKAVGPGDFGKPDPLVAYTLQTIETFPLSYTCPRKDDSVLQVTFSRALRINDLPDLPSVLFYDMLAKFPDIGTDSFLILEGTVTNMNRSHLSSMAYAAGYAKIIRPDSVYSGEGYSAPLPEYTTNYYWILFPIKRDERNFTVDICPYPNNKKVTIDFADSTTLRGIYRAGLGFTEGK